MSPFSAVQLPLIYKRLSRTAFNSTRSDCEEIFQRLKILFCEGLRELYVPAIVVLGLYPSQNARHGNERK